MLSRRDRARSLFRFVLLSAAAAAAPAAACGGSVDSVGGGDAGRGNGRGDDGDDPFVVKHGPDASPDVVVDAPPDRSEPETSGGGECHTGVVAADPSYCCEDGGVCVGGGGGDANRCALDCKKVCAAVVTPQTGGFDSCYWGADGADEIHYVCGACGVGRIPHDVRPCDEGATVAERLAMQAYYEAASVVAFRRAARTLEAAGAPEALVARVVRAADEEAEHARTFRALALARGAVVAEPEVDDRAPSLVDLAVENATEGLVRETYGAAVALHQAEHARDPELRAAFAAIADDEIDHAALSWELAAWLDGRLSPEARATVASARRAACAAQRRLVDRDASALDRALGLPHRRAAVALFEAAMRHAPELAA